MAQYKVLDNINMGQYKPGQIAEFDDSEAKNLLARKVIEPLEEKAKSKKADK